MIETRAPRWKMWTEEETQRLRVMWEKGFSASKIADQLGFTRSAVMGRIGRLKASGETLNHPIIKTEAGAASKSQSARNIRRRELRQEKRASIVSPPPKRPEKKMADVTEFGPDLALPESRRVGLIDLEAIHCRFPLGEPNDLANFSYCGADREARGDGFRVYCAGHSALAYRPAPPIKARAGAYR